MNSFQATRLRRCLLAAAVAQILISLPVVGQTASDARNQTEKGQTDAKKPVTLQTVVVTAQRRTQDIQKVPIAVTALNEAELNVRGITNVLDLSAVAPSLVVVPTPGTNTGGAIAIRGASTFDPTPYWDQPVAMYVDGVYIGKTEGNVLDLVNLERIEVLRGPQGTLFGRNTMAGAVSLTTRPPSGVFTGDASLGFGNYGSRIGKASVDLPAMGKFKVSLGGRAERRDGWIKTTPGSSEPELNNRHNNEAYAALEFDATDSLTFNYRFDYTKVKQYGTYNQVIHSDVEDMFGIPGIIVKQGRQTRASIDGPDFQRNKVAGQSLTAAWKLGDLGTIKYIGAYREMHFKAYMDNDGSPIPMAHTGEETRYHQASHELQYLGSYGRWNWVGGLYYFEDDGYTYFPETFFFGQAVYNDNEFGYGTRSRAAYAQVDYAVTDRLTLTAGVRRTNEQKHSSRYQVLLTPQVPFPIVNVPKGTKAKADFGATTPTLTLAYQATPDNMVYARYAKGFMSGGFNGVADTVATATTPYKPETQKTYEIGTKNKFLDDRLSVNADIYYNRVRDLQQVTFTASGALSTTVLNVGNSHQKGFELETHLRATEDLTVGLNYAYLKAKFDKYMVLGVNVADNRSVQFAPRHMASVTLDDVLAHTSKGILRASVDYRYMSKYFQYVYPITHTPGTPPSQLAGNSVIRSNGILNARISFGEMNWGDGVSGEVALWAKNLTNKSHIDNLIDFGPDFGNLRTANYNDPRMFGVTVTARW